MGKLVTFKRIAVTPIPPPAPVVIAGVRVPTRDEIEKMSCEDAFKVGEALGKAIEAKEAAAATLALPTTGKPTRIVTKAVVTKQVPPPTVPDDPKVGTVLFKESDTGIGFKRWAVWLEWTNRWTVWTEWGHENKHQARKQMSFTSETRAKAYLQSCVTAKLKRGYRRNK
jgi:hypothetical protein